jgi:hypothetical protein
MTVPDPLGELLAAMLTAWRRDIDAEPLRQFEPDLLRGEHAAGHDLAQR